MNNEPVAWMWEREINGLARETLFLTYRPWNKNAIPLYTHPSKDLTDEEIEKVRIAIMNTAYWCADENMPEAYNAVKVCCSEVLAILRKAQEK
jgi:hypothetical protein